MAWSHAQAQLVSIIEATTPTRFRNGLGKKFAHIADATESDLPDSRCFWFEIDQEWQVGPLSPGLPKRKRAMVSLFVAYLSEAKRAELFEDASDDHTIITSALLEPANWNRPTSTLNGVVLGGEQLMTCDYADVDGALLAISKFAVEFIHTVPQGGT